MRLGRQLAGTAASPAVQAPWVMGRACAELERTLPGGGSRARPCCRHASANMAGPGTAAVMHLNTVEAIPPCQPLSPGDRSAEGAS